MKKIIFILLLLTSLSLISYSQDDQTKKWMDYMTPGKEHQELAKMNGDWNFNSKFWMDPNEQPQSSDGTAKCEMLLDGRYMQMTVSGKMMGMDFKGIGVTGFDNGKKVWVSSWIDNFGTGLMYMEGVYDDASKKIVFTGKSYDPMSGKDMNIKQTIQTLDDKNVVMEFFNIENGKEYKSMEVKYSRK